MRQRRLGRGAFRRDHGLERGHHLLRRRFADHPPHALWRKLGHHSMVAILQPVHEHRLHQHAFIGNGAHGHHHLQARDCDTLTHRNLGDRHLAPLLQRMHDPADLPWERQTRPRPKAVVVDVIVEPALAHLNADLRGAYVRGLGDDVFHRQHTVGFVIVEHAARAELLSPTYHLLTPSAYLEVVGEHGTMMMMMMTSVVMGPFGNYLVPLMIGSKRVAFPRIEALSFWLTPCAFIILLSSVLMGGFPTGWTGYAPLSIQAGSGMDGYAIGFGLMGI